MLAKISGNVVFKEPRTFGEGEDANTYYYVHLYQTGQKEVAEITVDEESFKRVEVGKPLSMDVDISARVSYNHPVLKARLLKKS